MHTSSPLPDWGPNRWVDLPENPLVVPPCGESPGAGIGDPQVLLPGEFDHRWHMFFHGAGPIWGHFYHFTSPDGMRWKQAAEWSWHASPCFLMKWEDKWLLFYGQSDKRDGVQILSMVARTSTDLEHWSEPTVLFGPELEWEKESMANCLEVRNPSVVQTPEGQFRLYYSSGTILLPDCGYEEPKYISFATADRPLGPYRKLGRPILGPDDTVACRNFGAGAIKVYPRGRAYVRFNNPISRDKQGCHRAGKTGSSELCVKKDWGSPVGILCGYDLQ